MGPSHHQYSSQSSPILLPVTTNTPPSHHQYSSQSPPILLPVTTNTPPSHHQYSAQLTPIPHFDPRMKIQKSPNSDSRVPLPPATFTLPAPPPFWMFTLVPCCVCYRY